MDSYVYTGIFTTDEIHLDIAQKIERYLLKTESAWKFPKDFIAIYKYDFTDLNQFALNHLCKDPRIIFESKDFLKMEESTLINLLKCDSLWLEEKLEAIEIWEYLIKWGIKNTESILNDDLTKWTQTDFIELGKVLHNCIPHIRFSQLSHNKLRLIITQYKNILPDYFLEEIYNYLSDSKPKHNNLPKRGKSVFELEESKISGFVMSMFEKISRFIMSNGVQDVPEIRGLGMGSCIGCGAIKICAGCGELERCGILKYCAEWVHARAAANINAVWAVAN
ncbi:13697_t:CDS:2 [Gigaspora margarita]|uniref:13697_t:CDS:1 n=1 Tax=Gigaspora margarita TaxID=4874 RepID=A0ABN7V7P9_GIGMA|nr:13697_t:CDS:2 [Gigaspora margarita]